MFRKKKPTSLLWEEICTKLSSPIPTNNTGISHYTACRTPWMRQNLLPHKLRLLLAKDEGDYRTIHLQPPTVQMKKAGTPCPIWSTKTATYSNSPRARTIDRFCNQTATQWRVWRNHGHCRSANKQRHLVPCHTNANARNVADIYLREIWRHHGLPSHISFDRGTQFTSLFWNHFTKCLGIKARMSTAYHL
jgi:hypothetical protein